MAVVYDISKVGLEGAVQSFFFTISPWLLCLFFAKFSGEYWRKQSCKLIAICGFLSILPLIAVTKDLIKLEDLKRAYKNKEYTVAIGKVSNFKEVDSRYNSFELKSRKFQVFGNKSNEGFNLTRSLGSPLKNDDFLEIRYIGKFIVYVAYVES